MKEVEEEACLLRNLVNDVEARCKTSWYKEDTTEQAAGLLGMVDAAAIHESKTQ
jgi:hypothetical protein